MSTLLKLRNSALAWETVPPVVFLEDCPQSSLIFLCSESTLSEELLNGNLMFYVDFFLGGGGTREADQWILFNKYLRCSYCVSDTVQSAL